MKNDVASTVLKMLTRQSFRDFYEGPFDDWLIREEDVTETEDQILDRIKKLLARIKS